MNLQQFLVVLNGSLVVTLSDGKDEKKFSLERPTEGLFIDAMVWRDLTNFLDQNVTLVLASEPYDPDDYIRDYDSYVSMMSLT